MINFPSIEIQRDFKNITTTFFLCLPFIFSNQIFAQSISQDTSDYPYWIDMMQDPDANYYETVAAFEKYWEDRPIQKGGGWKPFKRWQAFMEDRINADGSKPAPDEVFNAILKKQKQSEGIPETSNASWTELGPAALPANGTGQPNGLGRINAIGFHPTDGNTIFLGTPQGGLWKTTDNGNTWSSNTDGMPTLGVSAVLINSDEPQTMYIGSGDRDGGDAPGLGVFKSYNGGTTWFQSSTGMGNRTVGGLLLSPVDTNIIFAATSGGVYKSTDGGANWTQKQSGNFKDIRFKPTSSTVMYASASGSFYRSTDAGENWTLLDGANGIPDAARMVIGVSAANPNHVYVVATNSATFKALYLSTDSGASFVTQSTTPNIMDYSTDGSGTSGQAWYDLCVAVDPLDINTLYVGGVNVFKSTDAGVTWTINAHWVGNGGADDIHADQHVMEYSPVNGNLYNGNDGGFYFTSNGGTVWTDKSSGLAIAQVYKIGQSATVRDLVINGYQDNGTAIYDGAWRTEIGGDGMECIIDYTNSDYIYGSLYYGDIRRSSNNGINFSQIAGDGVNGIDEEGPWITPYVLHETDPNTMFVGMRNIWRSTNVKAGTPSFTKITNLSTGSTVRVVEHSPANTNILYFARTDQYFNRLDLGASPVTVTDLSANLPNAARPTDIEAHPTDENIVYITQSNKVYKSMDKGVSWTDITGAATIPNVNTNCIVYAENTSNGLYVGTDAGVYYFEDGYSDWEDYTMGLPLNAEVTELEIYYDLVTLSQSVIRASTYGRGLWESPLQSLGSGPTVANFSASSDKACVNGIISLMDQSSWNPTNYLWTVTPNTVTYVNGTSSSSANPDIQFNATGSYTISLAASNALGGSTETKTDLIEILNSASISLEDFEGVSTCSTASDCGTTNCPLGVSWQNLENGIEDDIDWRADNGGTPSGNTGPGVDHTTGTSTGIYLYLEASSGCTNQTASLTANCIPIASSGVSELSLWYHMYGSSMGTLHIDIDGGSGWVEDVASPISGDQGDIWKNWSVNLSAYAGQTISIRVRGVTGSDYFSDIAIDDIQINGPMSAVANFSSNKTNTCINEDVSFTDESTGIPTSHSWTFTPNTVAYVNGTSSTSAHPVVQFNTLGTYTVALTASNSIGGSTETKTGYIQVVDGIAPPSEDFESGIFPPVNWAIVNSDGLRTWESSTVTGSGGTSTVTTRVDNFSYNGVGQEDEFNSVSIDLANITAPSLSFDLSYAPYDATYNDSMRVDIFTDCGSQYATTIYGASYLDLATAPTTTSSFVPSAASDWDNKVFDLSAYEGEAIVVKFINHNGYGNNLYIDNISITGNAGGGMTDYYPDVDGDGFGDMAGTLIQVPNGTSPPADHVADNTDCDDNNVNIYPGNTETCDGLDNNCDTVVDEGFPDTDEDSVADCIDNCPATSNESQENADGDNYGDACDCGPNNPNDENMNIDNNPITSGTYAANHSISSLGTVDNTSTVVFQAANSINLGVGFVATSGSDFIAEIMDCIPPSSSSIVDNEDENEEEELLQKKFLLSSENVAIKIFPNPFKEKTNIIIQFDAAQQLDLAIYNSTGNLLLKILDQTYLDKGVYQYEVDGTSWGLGVYHAVLRTSNETKTAKMMIIR